MIDLPEKFFFVLDAHQAAVVIAIFSILETILMNLTVGKFYCLLGSEFVEEFLKQITEPIEDETTKDIVRALPTIILWTGLTVCLFFIIIEVMLLLGVLKRKPCLLLPWMIVQVLFMISTVGDMIRGFADDRTFSSVIMDLLFFAFSMGVTLYKFLAVYACRRLLVTSCVPSRIAVNDV